jgi:hypothetical protein
LIHQLIEVEPERVVGEFNLLEELVEAAGFSVYEGVEYGFVEFIHFQVYFDREVI